MQSMTGLPESAPLCALTIDVEDWYQSCVDPEAPITERVVRNTDRVLALLDDCGVKATFFLQGRVAETFPQLCQLLVAEGHEVQSHGYSHRPLDKMDGRALRNELDRARKTVEDACGVRVTAFRAPDFSIFKENLWTLEALTEAGFEVDSSIFPMRTPRYGVPGWEIRPHYLTLPNGARILEIPVAIWTVGGYRFPVAGGGYLRFLPRVILKRALCGILNDQRPAIIYCHPYEFNAYELSDYSSQVSALFRICQGIGRRGLAKRIREILTLYPFGRLDEVLPTLRII